MDALLNLLLALVDLALGEVTIACVDCLELAAVDGNKRLREQLQLTAQDDEAATYVANAFKPTSQMLLMARQAAGGKRPHPASSPASASGGIVQVRH
ncbi:hypothetical protein QFZ97_008220 [Paraburkholderia youngii]